jgi:ribosomal protein S18 acetylase RimI-like enzyme
METSLHQSFQVEQVERSAAKDLFEDVAQLHFTSIHGGIFELLGSDFLTAFYRELMRSGDALLYIARRDQTTIGFVAGTDNLFRSVRGIGLAGFARLGFTAMALVWRPSILAKVLRATGYFFQLPGSLNHGEHDPFDRDRAELLAIAVAPEARGQGVGRSLVDALERGLQERGARREYFVSTNEVETASNAFYKSAGFSLMGKKRHHDLMLNIYRKEFQT